MEIDTSSLRNGAKNLEEACTSLGRDGEIKLSQAADRLKAGWSGNAANTYIKFLEAAADMAYRYQSTLKQYSETMVSLAVEIERANEATKYK